jgi:saccharopine dehydrogenase-like NADP-dependent oxidoreductase
MLAEWKSQSIKMKNVIILGASGNIAKHVIDILVKKDDINLTLFVRHASRLRNKDVSKCRIVEGDVLNFNQLKEAIAGQAHACLSAGLLHSALNSSAILIQPLRRALSAATTQRRF